MNRYIHTYLFHFLYIEKGGEERRMEGRRGGKGEEKEGREGRREGG